MIDERNIVQNSACCIILMMLLVDAAQLVFM